MEFQLDVDEGILLEEDSATYVNNDCEISQLTLTNKNIFFVCRRYNGLFSKATEEVFKRPLSEIKIINDRPMVSNQKNDYYDHCLQIQFLQGRDIYAFEDESKKNISLWIADSDKFSKVQEIYEKKMRELNMLKK